MSTEGARQSGSSGSDFRSVLMWIGGGASLAAARKRPRVVSARAWLGLEAMEGEEEAWVEEEWVRARLARRRLAERSRECDEAVVVVMVVSAFIAAAWGLVGSCGLYFSASGARCGIDAPSL